MTLFASVPSYPFGSSEPGIMEAQAATTFSQYWFQDELGKWKVKNGNGTVLTNAWLCDDAVAGNGQNVWYLLDASGNMVSAGLVQDATGNYYSLETNHDGYYGMLRYLSGTYDGVNLILESSHNGSFAKILNQDGINALTAKYGVTQVSISNVNCVYSSSFKTAAKGTVSGGGSRGGGGGGSSSGGGGGSSSGGGNSSTTGKLDEVVEEFKSKYIKDGMSDYEKEMMIIRYMVENIDYDHDNYMNNSIPASSYTAYGALVNGLAVCDGYSRAFQTLADSCGLTTRRVTGTAAGVKGWEGHAWNKIQLDGDWYNVDVTWEDPVPSNSYGFNHLRNRYINLTDAQLREDHKWGDASPACNSDKYSGTVTEYYLQTGKVDTEMRGDNWRKYIIFEGGNSGTNSDYSLYSYGYKFDDGSNYFTGDTIKSDVADYLESVLSAKISRYYLTFPTGNDYPWLTREWLTGTLGGAISGWYCYPMATENQDYLTYFTYYLDEDHPLLSAEQSKAILEAACEEGNGNVADQADTAKAYVKAQLESHKMADDITLTLVYKGLKALVSAKELENANRDTVSKVELTNETTVSVDRQPYVICSYKFTCNTLVDILRGKLEEDQSNLFTGSGDEDLAYLKNEAANRTSKSKDLFAVYEDGQHRDYTDEIEDYVKSQNIAIENIRKINTSPRDIEFRGKTYAIDQYRISYLQTEEEAMKSLSRRLEADHSNLFEMTDDIDGAVAYLSDHIDAETESVSYIILRMDVPVETEIRSYQLKVAEEATSRNEGYECCEFGYDETPVKFQGGGFYICSFYWKSDVQKKLTIASPAEASR